MAALQLLEVQQTEFAQLLGGHLSLGVQAQGLDLPVRELQDGGHSQVHFQYVEYVDFHVEHLTLSLRFVSDVHEVSNLGGLYFLLLAGNQHAGHAHQLEFGPVYVHLAQLAVDGVDGEEQGLGQQFELQMHFHQPVHQDATHLFIDVSLSLHLEVVRVVEHLCLQTVLVHILSLEGTVECVCLLLEVHPLQRMLEVDAVHH